MVVADVVRQKSPDAAVVRRDYEQDKKKWLNQLVSYANIPYD